MAYVSKSRHSGSRTYGSAGVNLCPECAQVGRGVVRREGNDVALLAYGTVTNDALKAADMLARSGVSATVVDMRYVGLMRTCVVVEQGTHASMLCYAWSLPIKAVCASVSRRQCEDVPQ